MKKSQPQSEASEHEFLPLHAITKSFYAKLDGVSARLPAGLLEIAQAFRSNLFSAQIVLALPLQIAAQGVHRSDIEKIYATAGVVDYITEPLKTYDPTNHQVDEKPDLLQKLLKSYNDKAGSPDGIAELCRRAEKIINEPPFLEVVKDGARELRYQACVMMWVAFEILAHDLFAYTLNVSPELLPLLQKDKDFRQLFDLKSIPMETVIKYRFDLSRNVGDLLVNECHVDTIPYIKTVYHALRPNNRDLRAALSARPLWMLFQRRHLIVHRRGLVDAQYIKNTGEALGIGSRINVSTNDLTSYLTATVEAGVQLIEAASSVLSARSPSGETGDTSTT